MTFLILDFFRLSVVHSAPIVTDRKSSRSFFSSQSALDFDLVKISVKTDFRSAAKCKIPEFAVQFHLNSSKFTAKICDSEQ